MSRRSKKLPVVFPPQQNELVDAAVRDVGGDFRRISNGTVREVLFAFAPEEQHELIRLLDVLRLRNDVPQVDPLVRLLCSRL
jgi:hypothetical protein